MRPHQDGPKLCQHCALPLPVSRRRSARGQAFCCFGCRIAHEMTRPTADGGDAPHPVNLQLVRLGAGIFLSANLMVFNWTFYSGEVFGGVARPGAEYESLAELFAYLQLFIASLVMAILGLPLFEDALSSIGWGDRESTRPETSPDRHSRLSTGFRSILTGLAFRVDANLLVCVAVLAAFALSAWNTVQGEGSLYFDTAAMVLVLLTAGAYIEARSRRRAMTSVSALDELPRRVWIRTPGDVREVDVDTLLPGAIVRVRTGEASAVDGVIRDGTSRIDNARLTGESTARTVAPGDSLLAGSLNLDGDLWVDAGETGSGRVIAQMQHLIDQSRQDLPAIQRVTDRVASVLTPLVILVALTVFGWHAQRGAPVVGLLTGLSVLLISCPCALGLAAPLACWSALQRAAGRGILFDSARTLEAASRVRKVFFDKTGTLTGSIQSVTRIWTAPGLSEREVIGFAAAVQSGSTHPIASGILEEAARRSIPVTAATEFRMMPGVGVEAKVGARRYRLGGRRLIESGEITVDGNPISDDTSSAASSEVYLIEDHRVIGRFEMRERVRPEAERTIQDLRQLGLEAEILTGDALGPAEHLAAKLDIAFSAELMPEDKVSLLRADRSGRGSMAMVGDGLNDAAVLASAAVGISVSGASDLAHQSGNVRLLSRSLLGVPLAIRIARHATRRIAWSLGWAFGYNMIGLTLAVAGLLSPVFAASSMAVSSFVVIVLSRGAGRIRDDSLSEFSSSHSMVTQSKPVEGPDSDPVRTSSSGKHVMAGAK